MSRSVMVTGGNQGIGLALARAFATDGDRVAVTHHHSAAPADLFAVRCDVTSAEQVEAAFAAVAERQGSVEVLVTSAGVIDDTILPRMTEERFRRVVDTNLVGAYLVARRATRDMLRARWGRMVFISSVAALSGAAGQSNYAASKAGLIGFARSLAWELGPFGITANVVTPGFVQTAMTAHLSERHRRELLPRIPVRRLAEPDEIAGAVRFLASADAGYVTGAVVPVDGGLGMGH